MGNYRFQSRDVVIILSYSILFFASHAIAGLWGGGQFFSIWYPPAGVRFAAMWILGPRWFVPILAVELAVQFGADFVITEFGTWDQLFSVIRPTLSYAVAIWLVRHWASPNSPPKGTAMQLLAAVILAPTILGLVVGIGGMVRPDVPPFSSGSNPISVVAPLLIGDLLGIILVAPPLLWMWQKFSCPKEMPHQRPAPNRRQYAEMMVVFLVGVTCSRLFIDVDMAIATMFVTMSIMWIGLRFGRTAAWFFLVASAMLTLGWSTQTFGMSDRYELHVDITIMAMAAFLAGSFSDNQWQMVHEINRRDRLLFQAERLKSIKAMSLAVIHDVSQPLSTLLLETQHLASISNQTPMDAAEVQASSTLIQRKVQNLSDMVQRLRRFGGREAEDAQLCSLTVILKDARELLQNELKKSGTHILFTDMDAPMLVSGYSIELTQAFYNLLHNAIASAPGETVVVSAENDAGFYVLRILNPVTQKSRHHDGFGIGSHISRTIIEAHFGSISLDNRKVQFETLIRLPEALAHA